MGKKKTVILASDAYSHEEAKVWFDIWMRMKNMQVQAGAINAEEFAKHAIGTPLPQDGKPSEGNPKDIAAGEKIPLHLIPPAFSRYTALALLEGAMKYGRMNWRVKGVLASVYMSAARRHMDAWFDGETHDPVTKIHHLANASACLAILIDATENDMLIDDRNVQTERKQSLVTSAPSGLSGLLANLRALFSNANPKHYDLRDSIGGK